MLPPTTKPCEDFLQLQHWIPAPHKSENLYNQLEEQEKMKKEVRYLEAKAKGKTAGQ